MKYLPAIIALAALSIVAAMCGYAIHTHDGSAISWSIIALTGVVAVCGLLMTLGTFSAIREQAIKEALDNSPETRRARNAKWPEQGKRGIR